MVPDLDHERTGVHYSKQCVLRKNSLRLVVRGVVIDGELLLMVYAYPFTNYHLLLTHRAWLDIRVEDHGKMREDDADYRGKGKDKDSTPGNERGTATVRKGARFVCVSSIVVITLVLFISLCPCPLTSVKIRVNVIFERQAKGNCYMKYHRI